MDHYIERIIPSLIKWQSEMRRKPSIFDNASKGIQNKVNSVLPETYHEIMTVSIKSMIKGVLVGSEFIAKSPITSMSLEDREKIAFKKIDFYSKTAMIEGAGTGAGGFLVGLADFPLLLGIKMKFLYDIAAVYGFDVRDYKERLFILYIFKLSFSSRKKTNEIYIAIENWENISQELPENIDDFNWREFQQEYRDYIDIAKLFQLLPFIGAVVGAYANSKLLHRLGETAMNAYRMRIIKKQCFS